MSFARFSEGDVYVYLNYDGLFECCACYLGAGSCVLVPTAAEMATHLEVHRAAGHEIPDRAFDELRVGAVNLDAYASALRKWANAGREGPTPEPEGEFNG